MFRTELHLSSPPFQLGLSSKVVTAGSCFSDAIGQKLRQYKVDTLINPFGTIFNPISLCHLFEAACSQSFSPEERLVQHQDRWYSYDFHSSFSSPDQEALVKQIADALQQTREFLQSAQLLVLTFGTALGYHLKDDDTVVANCHKLPDQNFDRRLLSYYDMVDAFGAMCAQLKMLNPDLKILLTVSPVRHLRETLTLNSVSKAHLRMACHHITENFRDVFYFPAFELMMDDLRDYRFYQDDLIHPSTLAEKYIWQKFSKAFFDQQFHEFVPEWDQIRRSLAHKPFHPESKGHQAFLRDLLQRLQRLSQRVDVTEELAEVRKQLPPEPPRAQGKTEDRPVVLTKKKKGKTKHKPQSQTGEGQEPREEANQRPAEASQQPEAQPQPELLPTAPKEERPAAQVQEPAPAALPPGQEEEKREEPKPEETKPRQEASSAPAPAKVDNRAEKARKSRKGRGKKVVLEPAGRKKQTEAVAPTPPPAPAPAPAPVTVAAVSAPPETPAPSPEVSPPGRKGRGRKAPKGPEPSAPPLQNAGQSAAPAPAEQTGPAKKSPRGTSRKKAPPGPAESPLPEGNG